MPKLKKGNLTADKIKKIKGYADTIISLSDFEAIRKRPGEFIGYKGNKGFINMVREIVQNMLDEIQKEDSPCTTGMVSYDEVTKTVSVLDNGRGIPFGDMHNIFTNTNTGSNFKPRAGVFASGMHGVGSKVVNALSHSFIVDSYMCSLINGKPACHHIEFKEGEVVNLKGSHKGEVEKPNKDDFQGTRVTFVPSKLIMGDITCTCEDVLNLVATLVPLMNIGTTVQFVGTRLDGTQFKQDITNQDGILTYIISTIGKPLIAPITISAIKDDLTMKTDIAFTFDPTNVGGKAVVRSFANACPTGGISDDAHTSVHTKAFVDEVGSFFRNHMNKVYLANTKSKTKVIADDVINAGLNAVITVSHIDPIFSGQAKEIFSNEDVPEFVKNTIRVQLNEWIKTHSDDLQKLCKYLKEVADLRTKGEKDKAKIVLKNKSSIDGLPAKYEKPIGKKNLELLIVEGDSAMGPARKARDPKRQGIFPIRGKFKNAMSYNRAAYFENEEAVGLRSLLGSGDGKNFILEKCPFDKIIVLADADVDGKHIRQLILKTMIVYYRAALEAGRFYFAQPPLYSVTLHNGKVVYFTTMEDYVEYTMKGFSHEVSVTDDKGHKIPPRELKHLIVVNHDMEELATSCCQTFSVDPFLLEFILRNRKSNATKTEKLLKKIDPYMSVKVTNGSLCFDGLAGEKIQTIVYNEFMENRCVNLINLIDNCPYNGFRVNGQSTTLLGLMNIYDKYQPSNIQRYKGLGEMDAWQLMESTLHPDYNRTLMQVTAADIDKEIQAIRNYDSNKKAILDMVDFSGYDL